MIDEKVRKFENWHILLWLFKDLCWVMEFKLFGTIMVVPTILVALWITFMTRKTISELVHNIAVVCWISANSVWMLGEFYCDQDYCSKPYARIFFFLGIGVLFVYYGYRLIQKARA